MGLISDVKRYKLTKEVESIIEELFGMSVEDIKKRLNETTKVETHVYPDDKEKAEIKKKYDNAVTPEEIVSKFAGEVEEFYPNGKPKQDN